MNSEVVAAGMHGEGDRPRRGSNRGCYYFVAMCFISEHAVMTRNHEWNVRTSMT